jgi:DNA recombination protein RmuC
MESLSLIIALAIGVLLGAAVMGLRAASTQRRIAEDLADARARLAERQNAAQEIETRAKLFAEELMRSQAQQLAQTNQTQVGSLLAPLKTQFETFSKEVSNLKETAQKDSTILAERIRHLLEAQQKISQDAQNLAAALKGDNKMMGDWGEVILERVLEVSGLARDREFFVQESHGATEDAARTRRPDVVIQLPEDRFLIVDSKVSLKAYEDYYNAEDEAQKSVRLKAHLASIRAHMEGLAKKNYQGIHGDRSPDFVMMFVPIEPAFLLATGNDDTLWIDGWNKHVLLVSPNTLLFVLRTVEYLWRQERLGKNAVDIANRGGLLYDKFVNFVGDLQSIGDRLRQAQEGYDAAHKKLVSGKGSLIRQTEMLKDLGVKPTKTLPGNLLERTDDEH